MHCQEWDHISIKSPCQHLIPLPSCLPKDLPYKAAAALAVDLPINNWGITDVCIDDLIPVCPDIRQNVDRASSIITLSLHILGRDVSVVEPLPCDNLLSDVKVSMEGGMAEIQIILGWCINTRTLIIFLLSENFEEWSNDIQQLLLQDSAKTKQLETLDGRLNHVAHIMSQM